MSELSFHRKYRPTKLEDYVGNQNVINSLKSAINSEERPQTILLYGESGCGKTTLARLIAKEYTCENYKESSCDECTNCKEVNKYIKTGISENLLNIQEIDITEQSGKNDLTDTLEDMSIPSFDGRYRVYIFDEIHMASYQLQNRLLKIAEEPPENILLIFCTTDANRVISTLRNRCQLRLNIVKPKVQELVDLLKNVLESENILYDKKGLTYIANHSDLCIRTALQEVEQVVKEKNEVMYSDIVVVFETVSEMLLSKVYKALKYKDTMEYVRLIHDIKMKMDLRAFLVELKNFTIRGVYTINGLLIEGITENELATYRKLFGDLEVEDISYILNKLLNLDEKNLELELLILGYTGLERPKTVETNEVNKIEELSNEVSQEQRLTDTILEEKKEEEYQRGINNTGDLMKELTLEEILAGGGSKIGS